MTNHGGKRTPGAGKRLGRQPVIKNAVEGTLYMSREDRAWLAALGAGNVSAGLRRARTLITELQARLAEYEGKHAA